MLGAGAKTDCAFTGTADTTKPMRIGIVGLLRGLYMAEWAERIGLEVAAICDRDTERLAAARARFPGALASRDWAGLVDAGLDSVILANDFDAHAELAVAFLEVSAFPVGPDGARPAAVVLVIRLSDGTLALARHGFLAGEPDSHWSWISVRGAHGLAESLRAGGDGAWSVRVRTEGWTRPDGRPHEDIRQPRPHLVNGHPVDRMAEGTVVLLEGFRATMEHGAAPLIPVRSAVAASLVGVAGAHSLAEGGRPVRVSDVSA